MDYINSNNKYRDEKYAFFSNLIKFFFNIKIIKNNYILCFKL
jgi:hypothetical protein